MWKIHENPWLPQENPLQMVDFHTALCAAGGIEPIVYPASMPKCEVGEVEGHPQVVAEKTIVKPWKNNVNPEPHFFRNFTILGWDLKIILRKNSCVYEWVYPNSHANCGRKQSYEINIPNMDLSEWKCLLFRLDVGCFGVSWKQVIQSTDHAHCDTAFGFWNLVGSVKNMTFLLTFLPSKDDPKCVYTFGIAIETESRGTTHGNFAAALVFKFPGRA